MSIFIKYPSSVLKLPSMHIKTTPLPFTPFLSSFSTTLYLKSNYAINSSIAPPNEPRTLPSPLQKLLPFPPPSPEESYLELHRVHHQKVEVAHMQNESSIHVCLHGKLAYLSIYLSISIEYQHRKGVAHIGHEIWGVCSYGGFCFAALGLHRWLV